MAVDGIFLKHLNNELNKKLLQNKVDKIYQPSKNEILINLRSKTKHTRLLISCSANNARVHTTSEKFENPKTPPMFCMLLRKKLANARLNNIIQENCERVLTFEFDTIDELGKHSKINLTVEIMGKYSNIILTQNNKILDCIKKIDSNISSKRCILPGLNYSAPPLQNKLELKRENLEKIIQTINSSNEELERATLNTIKGISPIVAKEIANLTLQNKSLSENIKNLCQINTALSGKAYLILDKNNKPIDITFMPITKLKDDLKIIKCIDFNKACEVFYSKKAKIEKTQSKIQNTKKLIKTNIARLEKKLALQKKEIDIAKNREEIKIKADLIKANLYKIQKGQSCITLENFYNDMKPIIVDLNPCLSANQNAQKYYKTYRKLKNSEKFLNEEINKNNLEIEYLESTLDLLERVESFSDIDFIRNELFEQGYIKNSKGKIKEKQKIKEVKLNKDFKVLIGKNNNQNDKITLKLAQKNDIWFHTKNIPGSHVVIITNNKIPNEEILIKAAKLAAQNSKARFSSKVLVDYTLIKHVKKPNGAKPGKVIYTNYKTLSIKL